MHIDDANVTLQICDAFRRLNTDCSFLHGSILSRTDDDAVVLRTAPCSFAAALFLSLSLYLTYVFLWRVLRAIVVRSLLALQRDKKLLCARVRAAVVWRRLAAVLWMY